MARLAGSSPSRASGRVRTSQAARGAGVRRGRSGSRFARRHRCGSMLVDRRRSRGVGPDRGLPASDTEEAGSVALPVRRRCGPGGGRGKAGEMAAPVGPEPAGGPAAEEGGAGHRVGSLEHVRVDIAVTDDLDGDVSGSSLPRSWARSPVPVSRREVFGGGGSCMVMLSPSASRRGVGCAQRRARSGRSGPPCGWEAAVFGGTARRSGSALVLRAGRGPSCVTGRREARVEGGSRRRVSPFRSRQVGQRPTEAGVGRQVVERLSDTFP